MLLVYRFKKLKHFIALDHLSECPGDFAEHCNITGATTSCVVGYELIDGICTDEYLWKFRTKIIIIIIIVSNVNDEF